jgi:Fe2+ transport system protein FeoA
MTQMVTQPLSSLLVGQTAKVVSCQAGRDCRARLTSMGLTLGSEVSVVRRGHGPVLVATRGTRLAIGRGMAEKIFVTPLDS